MKDASKATLAKTTFAHRYTNQRDIESKHLSNSWRGLDYGMSRSSMDLLEQKCSKVILDCVDWQQLDGSDD